MSTAAETFLADMSTRIGAELGCSPWIRVTQDMIDRFASTTRDEQWIHVDPERARNESPFGGTVAHGFLTLSLASRFSYDALTEPAGQTMSVNYGFEKLRFLTPVKPGDNLRGRFALSAVSAKATNQILLQTQLKIEIEGTESPALVAEWLSLHIFG